MTLTAPDRRPIGVFDSGIGGLSVLDALRAELPGANFAYVADSGHAPYGERSDAFVAARSQAIARHLVGTVGVQALVVACNTATAAAVREIRACYPGLPVVGVEPGLKPAAQRSRTGRVGVIGTRGTLESAKFRALLEAASEGGRTRFVVRPCDGLAHAIERDLAWLPADSGLGADISLVCGGPAAPGGPDATGPAHPQDRRRGTLPGDDGPAVATLCRSHLGAMGRFGSAAGEIDTLVLGCTHYVFATDLLRAVVGPDVALLDTAAPVARQTRRLLDATVESRATGSAADLRTGSGPHGTSTGHPAPAPWATHRLPTSAGPALLAQRARMQFFTTGDPALLAAAAHRWLGIAAAKIVVFKH